MEQGTLTYKRKSVDLTRAQFVLLTKLFEEAPKLVSWQELYEELKGSPPDYNGRNSKLIQVHLSDTRKKLRSLGIDIINRRQFGYRVVY